MGEMRQNKITKQWVIYAPHRKARPHDFCNHNSLEKDLPRFDPCCPFCPGNEKMLPSIIHEIPPIGERHSETTSETNTKSSEKNKGRGLPEWQTRVVPNKYPALNPEDTSEGCTSGLCRKLGGYGYHEVIIESPQHNTDLSKMSEKEIEQVLHTYKHQYSTIMQDPNIICTILFRNHGNRAGASLHHPHSQLIACAVVPGFVRARETESEHYYEENGSCIVCDMLKAETRSHQRVLLLNNSFCAIVPFAAEVPFEIWIIPRRHQADFASITEEEISELSPCLKNLLGMLYQKLNDPHYNFIINTCSRFRKEGPQVHWYIQIRPRLTTPAGFEIGSGIHINPSIPEEDAAYLLS
ncbi:MAG: DUF4931 domain-containing protein [Spirochaetota bacterium]